MEPRKLGKRIVVVGVSASGKTTFAKKLQKITKLPLTIMDEHQWNPGWSVVPDKDIQSLLELRSMDEEWIIEGYITKKARMVLFDRADTIIYLDYHPLTATWRYVKRWWKYRKNPRPELPGSPEKFSFSFLKLVYTKGETWKLEKLFKGSNWNDKIIRLKSPREAEQYLQNICNLNT